MRLSESRQNTPRGVVPDQEKECGHCGAAFVPTHNAQVTKYCSKTCAKAVRSERQKRKVAEMSAEGKMWGRPVVEHYFLLRRRYAEERGIEWGLSLGQYTGMWGKPCHYCGGEVLRGSIDRLELDRGFVEGNCVPSCLVCNMMKRTMSAKEYLDHCARVSANHNQGLF